MKGYILRRKGLGATSTPIIAEILDFKVINTNEEKAPTDADVVIRWGTTNGSFDCKIINKSKAIETSSDKKYFRELIQKEGLCPRTWQNITEFSTDIYGDSFTPQKPVQRVLIRPAIHARSEDMFLCTSLYEANKAIQKINGPYYISEFVQKKKEFRVMVVSGKVVWVIEKHPKSEEEVSWGCVEAGNFDYVGWSEWPIEVVRNATRAVEISGLDFGAADVIVDQEGKAYTLEVNTAPWLSPYYAKKIGNALKWLVDGKEIEQKEITDWKSAIHPSC
jgi:glutathione synthase/RimK-type ligase-like ATP-grasp enzyme